MKTYTAEIKSAIGSPYSQSRFSDSKKEAKETADAHEQRTWRLRMHVDENGEVFIPGIAFKNCLSEAAKYLSKPILGQGKCTYTKHIEAGVMIIEPAKLGIRVDNVPGETLFVPASGKRGDGKRVKKTFPRIDSWETTITIMVFDDLVTEDVLREHLEESGKFIGIGRFRPRNNGYYGRFQVVSLKEV